MSSLIITGGKFKGKKIYSPSFIRPTQSRIKKALFDILDKKIENASFLDLFAGSGNVGIEAMSRGANKCVFVEKNPKCIAVLNKNIYELRLIDKCKIIKADVNFFIKENKETFDVIFADPPYNFSFKKNLIEKILKFLKKDGIFILETSKRKKLKEFENLIKREVTYGETKLIFFSDLSR